MVRAEDFAPHGDGDPQFLAQLTSQSRSRRFAAPNLSAGELPLQFERIAATALADQQTPAMLDDGRNHSDHGARLFHMKHCHPMA